MPCIRANCSAAILENSGAWGFSGGAGICNKHFEEAKEKSYENGNANGVDAGLLADYARIFVLLEFDAPKVRECLRDLSGEIGNLEERTGYVANSRVSGHIKLSAALERYETYCWFPPCEDTFISQLPGDRFLSYIKRGLMAKDPGAGPNHGDFTHRIHWHIICRVVTNGFTTQKRTGWNHTPLRLYTYLGEGSAIAANLWTNLFELPCNTFRFPDNLNLHVCNGNYGALSVNMGRRYEKRKAEVNAVADQSLLDNDVEYVQREVPKDGVMKSVSRSVRAWEKLDAIGKASAAYATRTRGKYGQEGSDDPVLSRGPPKPEIDIEQRINSSSAGFNADFKDGSSKLTYDKRLGVARLKSAFRAISGKNRRPNISKF
jgi:hypothetical protein